MFIVIRLLSVWENQVKASIYTSVFLVRRGEGHQHTVYAKNVRYVVDFPFITKYFESFTIYQLNIKFPIIMCSNKCISSETICS